MEMRRVMMKRRTPSSGTLVCKKCKAKGLFMLLEGGRCTRCYVPNQVDYAPGKMNGKYSQTDETFDLKTQCDALIAELNLTRYRFARKIGCSASGFDNWHQGRYADLGQSRMNERVRAGILKANLMPNTNGGRVV